MFIKLSKAAKLLDVHRETLRRYIKQGMVDGRQLPSGHWRVEEASVKALLNRSIADQAKSIIASL